MHSKTQDKGKGETRRHKKSYYKDGTSYAWHLKFHTLYFHNAGCHLVRKGNRAAILQAPIIRTLRVEFTSSNNALDINVKYFTLFLMNILYKKLSTLRLPIGISSRLHFFA